MGNPRRERYSGEAALLHRIPGGDTAMTLGGLKSQGAQSEEAQRPPLFVLGVGNILLRDEGVGVHVVRAMDGMRLPLAVELLDGGTGALDLLDAMANRR